MASGQGLTLLSGPANAGKVALLLERYLGALERDPLLIVPHGSDVERIERELLAQRARCSPGTSGRSTTCSRASPATGSARPVVTDAQRQLIVRTAVSATSLNGLGASARFSGLRRLARSALAELESGLVDPGDLRGDLALLYASYRAELERLELWDRDLLRRHAAERVAGGARRLVGPAGVRVRVRGSDGRAVGTPERPRGPHRGHGLAPVRAESRSVRVAEGHVRRPELARGRTHRGAHATL